MDDDGETTYDEPMFLSLNLKTHFICVNWWMRQRIHNTLIVVDRYLQLMGDKMIPDSAEPRLESFYPPLVTGIDLPHQGVVDSYNLQGVNNGDTAVDTKPSTSRLHKTLKLSIWISVFLCFTHWHSSR